MIKAGSINEIGPAALGVTPTAQSKMALIMKLREDLSEKLRIIVDLPRSGANSLATTPQRTVLPRVIDAMAMCQNLAELGATDDTVELAIAEFPDAYQHLRAHADELPILWSSAHGKWILHAMLCFGLAGAPLVWCRLAAFAARTAQACADHRHLRLQKYADDPLFALRGTKSREAWSYR